MLEDVNMKNLDAMGNFMKAYNSNLNEINESFDDLGKIDANILKNDLELANDLQALTGNNNLNLESIQANSKVAELSGTEKTAETFSSMVNNYLNDVTDLKNDYKDKAKTFITGGNIDVHSVMIASERASTAMQMTMQLRNKVLEAYKQIQSTQV